MSSLLDRRVRSGKLSGKWSGLGFRVARTVYLKHPLRASREPNASSANHDVRAACNLCELRFALRYLRSFSYQVHFPCSCPFRSLLSLNPKSQSNIYLYLYIHLTCLYSPSRSQQSLPGSSAVRRDGSTPPAASQYLGFRV